VDEYGKFLRAIPDAARFVNDGLSAVASLAAPPKGRRRGPPVGPATPFNVPIGAARAFATASIPLAEVKAIARRHGATVNDVVLALVSGAARAWLAGKRALPAKPLVAAMPVSLRAEGDSIYTTRATMVLADLATHLASPGERLETIRAKSIIPMDLPAIGAPWVLSGIARAYGYAQGVKAFPPLANLVVSNVPGPQAPLYLAGARMLSWWPASIVEHGLGLNVTVESYCGSLDFGLVAAKAAIPDVRKLADALYDAHEELKKMRG
jgi:WS/DGAT/MGAT family acyltransferase